jgi:hypothetical protein
MIEVKVLASVLFNAYRDPAETTWLHTTFRTDDCIDKPTPSAPEIALMHLPIVFSGRSSTLSCFR